MLRKKEAFTLVTPIPGFIPRQLAIDILHSHSEVITLNPLVLNHKAISAPRNAAADEFYSTWYEIEERIQVLPGMGRIGSGKIKFNGCFHDMPWGLQTHIYAPMNIDLRNTYRICGNQPGIEPPEHREIGLEALGAPADGLYLREDIEIKANIAMVSFVKAQLKAANKEMVQRIIKKAELLDAGVLKAMMEDGKLKTVNPNDRSTTPAVAASADPRRQSSVHSPYGMAGQKSPQLVPATQMPPSYSPNYPHYAYPAASPTPQPYDPRQSMYTPQQQQQHGMYAPPPIPPKEQMVIMELPGDFPAQASPGLYPSPQPSPGYRPSSSDPRWSGQPSPSLLNEQRMSTASTASAGQHPGFVTELATHNEKAGY
ncbi:hypothetical protein TARUN_7440 [Trichoderma arundinaceum]|uniref:DUF7053 domain-containing protein n=1 Tax=Trichoderma arundinaceum TaxID=490622 RepID=A0A395NFB7_TRIAR|nr:hypothetical protein TARUN_7440 [Trichoderma arundinaceum]